MEKVNPSALTVTLPGSAALDVLCVSAEAEGAKQADGAQGTFTDLSSDQFVPHFGVRLETAAP